MSDYKLSNQGIRYKMALVAASVIVYAIDHF
jgi:hypothetical protein